MYLQVDQINWLIDLIFFSGNPCCEFENYREYVVAQLPQLRALDLKDITKSEQIKAEQQFLNSERQVKKCQEKYK